MQAPWWVSLVRRGARSASAAPTIGSLDPSSESPELIVCSHYRYGSARQLVLSRSQGEVRAAKTRYRNQKRKLRNGSADLDFEAKLWAAADALRNNMDAAEYKHVVLGLTFLKYISDAFEAKHVELRGQRAQGADPEDPDEYRAVNIFWVPPEARWSYLKSMAPQPTIGRLIDDAMSAIERDNASLKGICPRTTPARGSTSSGSGSLSIS